MEHENYIILKESHYSLLANAVNLHIKKGYKPFGNLIFKSAHEIGLSLNVDGDMYIQAMILKEKIK